VEAFKGLGTEGLTLRGKATKALIRHEKIWVIASISPAQRSPETHLWMAQVRE
jgi:hypothetical protein